MDEQRDTASPKLRNVYSQSYAVLAYFSVVWEAIPCIAVAELTIRLSLPSSDSVIYGIVAFGWDVKLDIPCAKIMCVVRIIMNHLEISRFNCVLDECFQLI